MLHTYYTHSNVIMKIFQTNTELVIFELKQHIFAGRIWPREYEIARLECQDFNSCAISDVNNDSYYPLKFTNRNVDKEVWVSCVAAGSNDQKAHAAIEALKIMGFTITSSREEEILTTQNASLEFIK